MCVQYLQIKEFVFCSYPLLNMAHCHHTNTHTHQHSVVLFVHAETCLWHPSIPLTETSTSHETWPARTLSTALPLTAYISHLEKIPGLGIHMLTYFFP